MYSLQLYLLSLDCISQTQLPLTLVIDYGQIISQRYSLRGFVVWDYMDKQPEVVDIFLKSVKEGKMKIDDTSEQIVPTKIEDIPQTWLKLFDGGNTGKLISKIE